MNTRPPSRIACVDVFALPLQLAQQQHPDWRGDPIVVVKEDKPLAPILWVNQRAAKMRITRGMKYAQAQALAQRLRATVIPQSEIQQSIDAIVALLLDFSPRVEPSVSWPGLFWIDPNGLEGLYGDLQRWTKAVSDCLQQHAFTAAVVVGFERFRVFALARVCRERRVLETPDVEKKSCAKVPLSRLALHPAFYEEMELLGVHTLEDFMRLPAADLQLRYGEEAATLRQMAAGQKTLPLHATHLRQNLRVELVLEPADHDHTRILFGLKSKLHDLIQQLGDRCEAIIALQLFLHLDHIDQSRQERIETAAPTLDVVQLLDLVRLRLSSMKLAAPIEAIVLEAHSLRVHPRQLGLLQGKPKRDLEAGQRALARIKALFGHDAVCRARIRDGHLPEAKFTWESTTELTIPTVSNCPDKQPLVRRLIKPATALPPRPKHEPDMWLRSYGAIVRMHGPSRVSGGWWIKRIERDYYFIETQTGDILWVYYDRPRRKWFLQGMID